MHAAALVAALLSSAVARAPMSAARARVGVIFDIDGTLCDSFDLAFGATQRVLAEAGAPPVSAATYHACTRYPTPARLARHCGLAPGDAEFERVGAELGARFDELYISLVSTRTAALFDGMGPLLARVAAAGAPLGALTNACVAYAEAVLRAHGVREAFGSVHGADDAPEPKPRPGGLLLCASELGVPPRACVYVGDSPSDGAAARAAGMGSVGVAWGSHAAAVLASSGHFDAIAASPAELCALLLPPPRPPPALRAWLLDRDGVLNADVGPPGVLRAGQLRLLPRAAEAVGALKARGHPVAVVTNQKAVGAGLTTPAELDATHARLRALLAQQDRRASLDALLVATGAPAEAHAPKPAADLPRAALAALGCEPEHAVLVGDQPTDAQSAAAAGVRARLVSSSAHGEAARKAVVSDAAGRLALPREDGEDVPLEGVHADLAEAVEAELAQADREALERAVEALARARSAS